MQEECEGRMRSRSQRFGRLKIKICRFLLICAILIMIPFLTLIMTILSLNGLPYEYLDNCNGVWMDARFPSPVDGIPHKLHQMTGLSPSAVVKHLTEKTKLHCESVDWEYYHWTDPLLDEFISENYPAFLRLFRNVRNIGLRSDIARYLVLHYHGGFYFDSDIDLKVPLDKFAFLAARWSPTHNETLRPISSVFFAEGNIWDDARDVHVIGNAVIGAVAEDPVMTLAVRTLSRSRNRAKVNNVQDDEKVVEETGPIFLTNVIYKKTENGTKYDGTVVVPSHVESCFFNHVQLGGWRKEGAWSIPFFNFVRYLCNNFIYRVCYRGI